MARFGLKCSKSEMSFRTPMTKIIKNRPFASSVTATSHHFNRFIMSSFGLTQDSLEQIIQILQAFPAVEKAVIFGSRAKGTNKRGSDVDIALIGSNLEPYVTQISYRLNEESLLPYFFDVVDYASITHQALKEHIDRVGMLFYEREPPVVST